MTIEIKVPEDLEVLQESLGSIKGGDKTPTPVLRDFRELKVIYFCSAKAEDKEPEDCVYYAAGKTGKCTFSDREFCIKELGVN